MKFFGGRKKQDGRQRRTAVEPGRRATFSYYQNRVIPEDEDAKSNGTRGKRQNRLHYIPTALAILAILASIGYMLSVSPRARIIVVNEQDRTTRSFLRPESTYEQYANEWLTGSPFDFTKLTLNTEKMASDIQNKFPELTHVSVNLPIVGRRPLVYVQVTQPSYTYIAKSGEGYILDEQGRAMMNAGDSLAPTLTRVKDDTQQEISLGSQVMPASQIDFMQTVQKQLAAKGIKVSSFELPARANELTLHLDKIAYTVKFSFANDARQQSGAFIAVKKDLDKKRVIPKQYVDVRVADRVYYK